MNCRKDDCRVFRGRRPATVKLLSPKLVPVRSTTNVLSDVRQQPLLAMRLMLSARCLMQLLWSGRPYHTYGSESSSSGILLFSRSLTPIAATHKHLSSARFFAVSYPSHMLLISCSLFLPLVHFPVILPSRMSRNNTSCRSCSESRNRK